MLPCVSMCCHHLDQLYPSLAILHDSQQLHQRSQVCLRRFTLGDVSRVDQALVLRLDRCGCPAPKMPKIYQGIFTS